MWENEKKRFCQNNITSTPIKKEVELISHFVYDNDTNQIIGNVYLTADQAYQLNKIMKSSGANGQKYAFLQV